MIYRLCLLLLLSLSSLPFVHADTASNAPETVEQALQAKQTLPNQCSTECVTPYGEALGTATGEVVAYSNCRAGCVVFEPNEAAGTYTGIKWQCVEFARRWLLLNLGMVYGDVDVAADIWDKIEHFTRVSDQQTFATKNFVNGSAELPAVGDLLIYARVYFGTGHVAVVTAVDAEAGRVQVAEQNLLNKEWDGKAYAREIEFIRHKDGVWLLEPYLIGWKRVVKG